jgi:hypothetical protein
LKPAIKLPTTPGGGLKSLKGKTIEDILNKWQQDLDQCTKDFHRQAVEVQGWDRVLIENGHAISKLYKSVGKVDETQNQIEQTLEYIESQQQELGAVLDQYEMQIRALMEGSTSTTAATAGGADASKAIGGFGLVGAPGGAGGVAAGRGGMEPIRFTAADEEREKTYALAENLNKQVDEMGRQLASMIEDINSAKGGASGAAGSVPQTVGGLPGLGTNENPITQIVKILDTHLTSLQWLDSSAEDLGSKVMDIRRRAEMSAEESERVHRLKTQREREMELQQQRLGSGGVGGAGSAGSSPWGAKSGFGASAFGASSSTTTPSKGKKTLFLIMNK